jgi:predicted thioesterase
MSPTPVGATFGVSALLELIEDRRLTFRISVNDERGLVASGRFTRVLISHERLGERLAAGKV